MRDEEGRLIPLCNSRDLVDGGLAVPFDVEYGSQTCTAFAIRTEGQVHAYVNRCTHVWVEMDSQPNRVFDGTRTADETRSKPHPQMLDELVRQFGVEPARTLMIGDTTHDLQLAANAGTASLAVAYGAHAPSEFAAHSPVFTANSVAELAAWLDSHA